MRINVSRRASTQTVGNVGLYYVAYRLSRLGWNVMPTARNARGIDLLIYSNSANLKLAIQVKALSKANPVPLGPHLEHVASDYWVICRNVATEPECFILTPAEVSRRAHRGEKEGRVSYWLQPRDYATEEFRDRWDRIGNPNDLAGDA